MELIRTTLYIRGGFSWPLVCKVFLWLRLLLFHTWFRVCCKWDKEMTKMHTGTAFLSKYLLAADGDSQLISIQVKRESHINTGTTLPHLLPATVMVTAELSSSSMELLLKKGGKKQRRGILAMCSMWFHLCFLWRKKARPSNQEYINETGNRQ